MERARVVGIEDDFQPHRIREAHNRTFVVRLFESDPELHRAFAVADVQARVRDFVVALSAEARQRRQED